MVANGLITIMFLHYIFRLPHFSDSHTQPTEAQTFVSTQSWNSYTAQNLQISYQIPQNIYVKYSSVTNTLTIKDFAEESAGHGYSITIEKAQLEPEKLSNILTSAKYYKNESTHIYIHSITIDEEQVDNIYIPINDREYYYIVRRIVDPNEIGFEDVSDRIVESIEVLHTG